ncbi:MAG: O-antigen ligase family protein [Bacteroidota bacterium]|nr:O-antigen ligase family protein [Bacteroidota bacterium]
MKKGIKFIIYLSIVSCFIVILQNLGSIDFLWNDVYREAYHSFLSGTLGPNKIVLGMTSLFSFSLCLGNLISNKYKINRILLIIGILLNLYIIILSGSRTTYIGLIVLLLYFALRSPIYFIVMSTIISFLLTFLLSFSPDLSESLENTLNSRIFNKTDTFEDNDSNVGDLYSDLGSGRDQLTIGNALYILDNPQIIPFGAGFMNRFNKAPGLSAHNMYLQIIKETGLVGFFLYFGWLISYLLIDFKNNTGYSLALKGLVYAMLVTLFFGEHLYIYRPLFGLLGLFLIISAIFVASLHKVDIDTLKQRDELQKS